MKEVQVDCSLASESLYISGMENLKKKAKSFKNALNSNPAFPMIGSMNMNQLYTYNPYANFNPYTMNAFYGNFANYYATSKRVFC